MKRVVIVGNGPAAHRLVERLRARGHTGPVVVLGDEPHPAYNRVLLGSVLSRSLPAEALRLPDVDAEVRLGVAATGIDRDRRVVRTSTGEEVGYDVLVLATGARARLPEITGLPADRLRPLRTVADCEHIARVPGPVVVLGGGVLGVEAALALRSRGRQVAVVHPRPHPMDRQLDATGGRLLAERLTELGVALHQGRKAVAYRSGALVLDDGAEVPAQLVVACTGVVPETALAERAGLRVRRGIVVDDRLRTGDPRIHAIGDCAEHHGRTPGLIGPAWEQADALAGLLCGADTRYPGPGPSPGSRRATSNWCRSAHRTSWTAPTPRSSRCPTRRGAATRRSRCGTSGSPARCCSGSRKPPPRSPSSTTATGRCPATGSRCCWAPRRPCPGRRWSCPRTR